MWIFVKKDFCPPISFVSSPQPCQLLLNYSNLGFGVGFLFAFLVDDGGRSITHEALVESFMACFGENCSQICEHQIICLFLQHQTTKHEGLVRQRIPWQPL